MAWADHVPAPLRQLAQRLQPFRRAFQLWSDVDGMRMSAAMSFYGILSLAPLLLAIVGMLGWWLDREVLERQLVEQLGAIVGQGGAGLLAQALHSAKQPAEGIAASLVGFGVLLFGATGVFGELQDAFERVWADGRGRLRKQNWRHTARMRLRGVGYVLVLGFLLLVSLMISTLLNIFQGWAGTRLPLEAVLRVLNELAAFVICAALFLGLMRMSGGAKPRIRYLLAGAFAGAILFTLGRQLLTFYLSTAAVGSAYGAAGSLVVLLMWIYFSSAVLLFGAAFARALEEEASARQQGTALGEDQGQGGDDAHRQQHGQPPAVAGVARP